MALPKVTNKYPEGEIVKLKPGIKYIDRHLTQENSDKINKNNPDIEFLNAGANGIVLGDKNPNHVYKITRDITEFDAAKALLKKPCSCIVRVFSAKAIQNNVWQIELEKVIPLIDNESSLCYSLSDYASMRGMPSFNYVTKRMTDTLLEPPNFNDLKPVYDKFAKLINCIVDNGFSIEDAHSDNIGKRQDGSYVLLDLGGAYIYK